MTMRRVAASLVPPWLEHLLTTPFFFTCPSHSDAARSECNMYCLDCSSSASGGSSGAFCFYCRSDRHSGHRVIQIRRSSYHDVVRVSEIQKALDITGVQTYVINSARVLFLNERPQTRASAKAAASPHTCEICSRSLLDPVRFCSLGCKLVWIKRDGDASFVPKGGGENDEPASESGRAEEDIERLPDRREGSREGSRHVIGFSAPASSSSSSSFPSSRRRKGFPHRAPFGS
ncbi:protein RGF1 INDUCIBLE TRANSCRIPTION FACTOR 1 [Elaeis guineensis]|uniref:Uncharacterized protein LOC105059052 n=1 Tax=Elaeis guineensis var. tenera TaxID=51953 RepID=A0A6I9SJ44_ELAGV|nr:uncharacterized protein LOC105059052 [Elaeis guineensis]XP_010940499.1 uncharacterized protein LOC105059052 [Elaeis guineensis]XP_029116054.1 uncharacterized protein LOC105059052 [Elaeis guineensis]